MECLAREFFGWDDSIDANARRPLSPTLTTLRRRTRCTWAHGTRPMGRRSAILVDGAAPTVPSPSLLISGEDVLIRWPVGEYGAGSHTIQVTHNGATGTDFYFDFLEAAVPSASLPSFDDEPVMTAATDWDTDHSIALAPERTAWFVDRLGFKGRANIMSVLCGSMNWFARAKFTRRQPSSSAVRLCRVQS